MTGDFEDDGGRGSGDGPGGGFRGVQGRGTVDYLLRNMQQELVSLSSQADFKASILITACSVVLTIGAAQVRGTDLGWELGVLAAFLLGAMVFAALCVLPSFRSLSKADAAQERRNPLFFGNFTHWTEDEYVDVLGRISHDDAEVYTTQARDLHQQGSYLVTHKYRFLRVGYALFLGGFVATAVVAAVSAAVG